MVTIFGPGGVGKSTLGIYLAPDFDPKKITKYSDSPGIEEQWLNIDKSQNVWIAPGQEDSRIETNWPVLYQRLQKAKKRAVIVFVVAYGHSTPLPRRRVIDWPGHLAEQRALELKLLDKLVSYFEQSPATDLHFLTVVTKEDLWWLEREAVQKHYEEGEYKTILDRLYRGRQFRHEFAYLSLRRENLKNAQEETPGVPTAPGYDDVLLYAHQEQALKVLKELIA